MASRMLSGEALATRRQDEDAPAAKRLGDRRAPEEGESPAEQSASAPRRSKASSNSSSPQQSLLAEMFEAEVRPLGTREFGRSKRRDPSPSSC